MRKILKFVIEKLQDMFRSPEKKLLEERQEIGRLKVAKELARSEKASGPGIRPKGDEELLRLLDNGIEDLLQSYSEEVRQFEDLVERIDLDNLDDALSEDEKDNLVLSVREYRQNSELPQTVRELVDGESGLRNKWGEADNVEDVEEEFTDLVYALREFSGQDYGEVLGIWEPNIRAEEVDEIITEVRDETISILDNIPNQEIRGVWNRTGGEVDESRSLEEVAGSPAAVHEFLANYMLSGNPIKMPVRIAESGMEYGNPLMAPLQTTDQSFWAKSLDTTAHEFGHTFGRQNLSEDHMYLPLGEPPSEAVDEGSARFYQNHIFRSGEFLQFLSEEGEGKPQGLLSSHGIPDFEAENLYGWFNAIDPENTRRISADPLTYPLHVAVRYELEKELIESSEPVEDMVENLHNRWEDKMQEYIGDHIGVEYSLEESETVLQDVHWGKGKFGYFPNYTMGDVMASNWKSEMNNEFDKDVSEYAQTADLDTVNNWVSENIWKHGKAFWDRSDYTDLDSDAYIQYLRSTADELYGTRDA
jgi:carboxypeptidase Taq